MSAISGTVAATQKTPRFGGSIGPMMSQQPSSAPRPAQCAIVLEDNPVGDDSKLAFQSFPTELEESYSVAEYREIGGNAVSQPIYAAYQGGNWGTITLSLVFVAGMDVTTTINPLDALDSNALTDNTANVIDNMLIDMQRQVDWCYALQFPLERDIGPTFTRVLGTLSDDNKKAINSATQNASNVKRVDPPIILLVLGSWMVIRGYVKSCVVKWQAPFHPVTARPMSCEVQLTIQPLLTAYPTWQTVRNRAGMNTTGTIAPELQGAPIATSAAQQQMAADMQRRSDNAAVVAEQQRAQQRFART